MAELTMGASVVVSVVLSCAQTGRLIANMNTAAQLAHETTNFWYLERDLKGARVGIISMIINHSQASCLRNYLTTAYGDASFSAAPAKYMKIQPVASVLIAWCAIKNIAK